MANLEQQDAPDLSHDTEALYDPPPPPAETVRPSLHLQEILNRDAVPPPACLRDDMQVTMGTEPISASRYFSPAYFELEKEKLWPKVWQFTCWANDIPNPGDIHVYRILERSVLIVRQRDGSVRAFMNACRHRGRELCEEDAHQSELKCPYHFFTWGLDGELKWVPSRWDFPQLDEANFRLPQVRVEAWNGFLFINFDVKAAPLAEFMGARFVKDWQAWDFSGRFKAVHFEKHIRCNWKTGQDAFIEAFHGFASHGSSGFTSPDDCGQLDVFPEAPNVSRFHIPLGYPSTKIRPAPSNQRVFEMFAGALLPDVLGTADGELREGEDSRAGVDRISRLFYERVFGLDASALPTADVVDAIGYSLFPNFQLWPCLAYPLLYRFLPGKDADWCVWETMLFFPFTGERPPSAEKIVLGPDDPITNVAAMGELARILEEDAVQVPAVQRGMRNLLNNELVLTEYNELRIRHYHKRLEQYIGQ